MKTYTVELTETELRLFSEFLSQHEDSEQKEFARLDYAGLNKIQKAKLHQARSVKAAELRQFRNKVSVPSQNKHIETTMKKAGYPSQHISGTIRQEGHMGSKYRAEANPNTPSAGRKGPHQKIRDMKYDETLNKLQTEKQVMRRQVKMKDN